MKTENKTNKAEVKTVTAKPGRPVNQNSARQKRLKELAEKRINGELKRGRPVNENSARQKRLVELEAKAKSNGGTIKRGRPVNENSARQKRLAELEAKAKSNGGTVKRGRPAKKVEEVVETKTKKTTAEKVK